MFSGHEVPERGKGMKTREDGGVAIRQSWLNDFLLCPERARRNVVEPDANIGSDLTVIGTAMHAVIEQVLSGEIDPGAAAEAAPEALQMAAEAEPWKSTGLTPEEMVGQTRLMSAAWADNVYPIMPPGGQVEYRFEFQIGEADGTPVWFEGTIDYVAPNNTVWDHKSASRKYQQWEKQRWAVQPSVYCAAAVHDGLVTQVPVKFFYDVMLRNGDTQIVELQRDIGHISFVRKQALSAAQFALRYGMDNPWPLNDQSALCSHIWCPFWDTCKGADMSGDELTWKP